MAVRNDAEVLDAIVVGAGFAGLRMLHELRQLGMTARVIEAGSDVGGTWYWNQYPGARTDSESWAYCYYFSKELLDEWDWTERFPTQPETLAYLRHVSERFELRNDIEFDSRVVSAHYDEAANTWTVATEAGKRYVCTYFISAVGLLTVPYTPPFPGIEDFTGDWYVTGRWPHEGVDFTGKNVVIVGTGATAVQAIPIIAQTAAWLTVLQRTPNFVMPARNYVLTPDERQAIRADYDTLWGLAKEHFFGFPMRLAGRLASESSPEQQQRVLERGWETGGFRVIFETFDDILTDPNSNELAAEFVRNKIRAIVHDPETAELLCPKDHPLGGKRPPLGHFYYETFNRDNVRLVSVRDNPITGITANGVRTATDEHQADIIVFATGFDAVTGSVLQMDVRGRDEVSLADRWREGPRTHLGMCVDGFPNMFMLSGPQSAFANIPVAVEGAVEWISATMTHMREHGHTRIEPRPEAVTQWRKRVLDLFNATVLRESTNTWFMGHNIPGKPREVLFYFGGSGLYRQDCQAAIDNGYADFEFSGKPELTAV